MAAPMLLLFLTDLSVAQQPSPYRFSLRDLKGPGRLTNDSAILSDIDDRDTFCRGNANAVFPDPYAYNIYYRCRRNRRETWKCIGDLYFDRKSQKCSPMPSFEADAPPQVCHQQEDGLYPLYNTNCKRYVRCKGETVVDEKECRTNEVFSYHRQTCLISPEAKCVQATCAANSDDFFIHPGTKCQGYYFCRKGVRFDFLCPKGHMFDLRSKKCVDGGICYEAICVGRTNGIYADTTHACDRYFRCVGGEISDITSCPKNLKYNGFACVPAGNVRCEKPGKTAVAVYYRSNDECKLLRDGENIIPGTDCKKIRICQGGRTIGMSECPYNYRYNGIQCYHRDFTECEDRCLGRSDGYYPDESKDCREYYNCHNGRVKEVKKCENGTFFDGKVCSSSSAAFCGRRNDNQTSCAGLEDGYHPDYVNGCRDYVYCHNRELIFTTSCQEGMRWNGSHCVGKEEFRCEGPQPSALCPEGLTGLYQDTESNCTNYVYCRNGMGTVLSCSNGDVFDGSRCVHPEEYTCPNAIRDECYNQPDGYRQDENSNCRSYFFCSNGRKITYLCGSNLVFNGTHCVSPKLYSCPYHTNDCDGKHNGYYPDERTGCKKYYYCLFERRITTLTCRGKKIFNGNSCVQVNDAKGTCARAESNQCRGRRDGRYSDRKGQCQRYILCENERMDERHCPSGTAFNGTACSPNYRCPSKEVKPTCDGIKMGFIPDYESGCKNYFFCIGGLKMIATCPAGTIFNGQVCQDSRTYACPSGGTDPMPPEWGVLT